MKIKNFFKDLSQEEKNKILFSCMKKNIKNKIIKKVNKIKKYKIGEIVFFKENDIIKGLARICGFTLNRVKCRIKYIDNSYCLDNNSYSSELLYKDSDEYEYEILNKKNLIKQNGKFYFYKDIIKPFKFKNSNKIKKIFFYQ